MKVRIDFTVDIPDRAALAELSTSPDREGMADFLRYEAQEHVVTYLEGMGISVTVVRANGARWGE